MISRVRQSLSQLGDSGRQRPSVVLAVFGVGLALVLGLILTVRLQTSQPISVGAPSPRTINAPRDITFDSPILTEAARQKATNDPANLVYDENRQVHDVQRQQLQDAFTTITAIRDNPSLDQQQQIDQLGQIPTIAISPTLASTIVGFDGEAWQSVRSAANQLYDRTLREYDYTIDEPTLAKIKQLYLPYNVPGNLSDDQRAVVLYVVDHMLRVNRILNEEATQQQQAEARAAVEPVTVTVVRGENIVRQGDRVSGEQYEKLVKLGIITPSLDWSSIIGRSMWAMLAALALSVYMWNYQPTLMAKRRALLSIGGLLVLAVLIGRVFSNFWFSTPELFTLAMVAMPLAVLFNSGLALVVSGLVAFTMAFMGDTAVPLISISLAGAIAGIIVIHRADRAAAFFKAAGVITLTVFVAALMWRMVRPGVPSLDELLFTALYSVINGVISALVALGLYFLLGRLAQIVTPMQLMELAHPNQPLLRRLMQEAPGTYHHSIVVSNLAEHAAEQIGADTLLTRVGAYYHDTGKMLRPYFFTDNQYDRSNVHDSLDPKTSAKLISEHVTEGAKLARSQGVPDEIVAFILEHHGTDVIRYFYQQALQHDDEANIDDYRYPGPKPQSKETAIMMLADGVEATVRSREQAGQLLSDHNSDEDNESQRNGQTISQVVDQIVNARLESGQLDESPLTLHDIDVIRRSFVKTLQGIYHPRVDYPKLTKDMQTKS